mmetsp:Transcript_12800/g.40276  ORF Transcript_12800/g.40276 Transcript_12800/m.40276 type:complete len:210 (-) Transcript_12800:369-998(-)
MASPSEQSGAREHRAGRGVLRGVRGRAQLLCAADGVRIAEQHAVDAVCLDGLPAVRELVKGLDRAHVRVEMVHHRRRLRYLERHELLVTQPLNLAHGAAQHVAVADDEDGLPPPNERRDQVTPERPVPAARVEHAFAARRGERARAALLEPADPRAELHDALGQQLGGGRRAHVRFAPPASHLPLAVRDRELALVPTRQRAAVLLVEPP